MTEIHTVKSSERTKSEQIIAISQSHIINPSLTSFARSVEEALPLVFIAQTLWQYFPVQTKNSINKALI